ncbi:GNAT family N-acetyltransferase [Moraxella sp. Pampa]|uniref:GNAT family N-acetyltransferase n=1 Tax=Moraxella sp. Pampa TaxID=3111978 RepID=UPI002B414DCB|nr:GNAT family N-acetyltransferase [Moraxella sp. Pampa]
MLSLSFYQSQYQSALRYHLDDEQSKFTTLPSKWLNDDLADKDLVYKIVILLGNLPIGFFVLDGGKDKCAYTNNQCALLLRSMSINPSFQGQGLAKSALLLLSKFITDNHILCDQIVLGVNHKNIPAQSLYQKVGFIDTGRTLVGIKGVQYIYELNI